MKAKKAVKKEVKKERTYFIQSSYSKDIKAKRKDMGFTLREAAKKVHLPITTLHWMEKGNHVPNVEAFAKTVAFYKLNAKDYIR